jgi:CRISPR system Cascade subunit CasA
MEFNLIREKWIPVRRRDGTKEQIAPWEITGDYETNPVAALDAPRPDFNGALIQFLIGLVQTAAAPEDDFVWEDRFNEPPTPEKLKDTFSHVAGAFELGGDGPRFMQDFEPLEGDEKGIGNLLIDVPGDNALDNNTDHFVKRGGFKGMCPCCCATALFTLQTNAPGGGQGHRTSLRGGGPLTTLVLPDSGHSDRLWEMVWLNVLEKEVFLRSCGNPARTAPSDRFPWLAPTRTSERSGGCETTPQDVHPVQMFWGMPRRIRLNLDDCAEGICELCGRFTSQCVSSYVTKSHGVNYAGPWLHPLSPHSRNKEDIPVPIHAQPGGVSYRHWLGLVQEDIARKMEPARIVHHFRESRPKAAKHFRIWAFGYDIVPGQSKARCWYESSMPCITVPAPFQQTYQNAAGNLVMSAGRVCENMKIAIKRAWHGRLEMNSSKRLIWKYTDIKKLPNDEERARERVLSSVRDKAVFLAVDSHFWQQTEERFYRLLESISSIIDTANCISIYRSWHNYIHLESLTIFDSILWNNPIEVSNPKSIVLARRDLIAANYSKQITVNLLDLP